MQKAITSSLQKQMSAVQATATFDVTAITAIVSDYVTIFTGVPPSTTAVVATAIAAETVVPTADAAQSTLIAAASTPTSLATASAAQAQVADSSVSDLDLATERETVTVTVFASAQETEAAGLLAGTSAIATATAPALGTFSPSSLLNAGQQTGAASMAPLPLSASSLSPPCTARCSRSPLLRVLLLWFHEFSRPAGACSIDANRPRPFAWYAGRGQLQF